MFLSQILASENTAVLQFVKLTENALPPTRELSRPAGFDLRSAYDVVIPASGNGFGKNRSGYTTAAGVLWEDCTALWIGPTSPYTSG